MIDANLRHLRVFLSVVESASITRAAEHCHVTQPAVTQAIAKLETEAGQPLFHRTRQGFFPTAAGEALQRRAGRAMTMLDLALGEIAPRLRVTATRAQLQALVAAAEAQNFSLAARQLGIAQPSVHRAVTQLEREAGRALFQRNSTGIAPTRGCLALAQVARLAFVELAQAQAELGELAGSEVGEIVIGAMPLSRAHILPRALTVFRETRPNLPVKIVEGSYDELLAGLRRGTIDFLIGALRDPLPIDDVVQERVFDDTLAILAGPTHPLLGKGTPTAQDLAAFPWLVARRGTPTRHSFDALFTAAGVAPPRAVIETGSVILMREMVQDGRHLACVSRAQAGGEIARGLVHAVTLELPGSERPIGLTRRRDWVPTPAQALMLDCVRAIGS